VHHRGNAWNVRRTECPGAVAVDKPPPENFNPYSLADKPVQDPAERQDKGDHRRDAEDDDADEVSKMLPFHLPSSLRKLLFTGTCCTGVVVLYFVAAWDHGLIPGTPSPFASASDAADTKELVVLYLGRDIRDLRIEVCRHADDVTTVRVLEDQIDQLQRRYFARTGKEYPYISCPKV
jgi:hypothetical protein